MNLNERIIGLDLIRAIAIIQVLIVHGLIILNQKFTLGSLDLIDGVEIFFVLSGYLIGSIYINIFSNNNVNIIKIIGFWLRRWFRTIPNYFLSLVISLLVAFLVTNSFGAFSYKYLFFAQNIISMHPSFAAHNWSLAIEEWFYIALPLIFMTFHLFLKNLSFKNKYLITILTLIAIPIFFRFKDLIFVNQKNADFLHGYFFREKVLFRLDSLAVGLIGSYIKKYYFEFWMKNKLLLLIIGILLFSLSNYLIDKDTTYRFVFSFLINSISILLFFPFFEEIKIKSTLVSKMITFISSISYSLYLLHFDLILWPVLEYIPINSILTCIFSFVLYVILSLIVSYINYQYFEIKMTNLRDNKLFKKLYSR